VVFLRQSLLVLFALILSGVPLLASEQRDFDAATAAFNVGMWSRAETEFADFAKNHPKSKRLPEAILMEAEASYQQGKLDQAVQLLQSGEPSAGSFADQYAYWVGQSQFAGSNYDDAAQTFAGLAATFTNSPWQLDAVVNEAAARANLGQWPQVEDLLEQSPIFQDAATTNATDERVLNGRLLLAKAFLAQNRPNSAVAVLQSSSAFESNAGLDWRRLYLLCQAQLQDGHASEALALTTNLVKAANRANSSVLRAQSVAFQAGILETNGALSDAVSVYEENLTNNAPEDWQRQAVLKIAELSARQNNFSNAITSLENFQSHFTNSPAMDSVVLALGELHLKNYVKLPSTTNDDLLRAQSYFSEFIGTFTNSPLLGRAYLDRGWCFWIQSNWLDSATDFRAATEKLPQSVDVAVARFKLGDAQFRQTNLVVAYKNYQAVVDDFAGYPVVQQTLVPQALYQMLRISIQEQDRSGATNAVAKILKIYPVSPVAESSLLIEGEALSGWNDPLAARSLFQQFEQDFPNSDLLPDVELEIAQTYERQNDWPAAISIYDSWIERFKENVKLPAVKYARAWANFKGGREATAFLMFTNFLAEYPSNADLTPVAQWWLGDYYSGQGDWANAEENYEMVFQYWPGSTLAYPAMLMAGRAAMGRQGYDDAKDYFTKIIEVTNCPPLYATDPEDWYTLNAQAWFAYGDVQMQQPSSDTNNPFANYKQAITIFQEGVCQLYPGSVQAALAWGEICDCYLQLATQSPNYYTNAADAYTQVVSSPVASIAERSQAQVGIGLVFEKRAALDPANQTTLLQSALNNYLDVFFGKNLRDGESADPFWVKQAGLQAVPLIQQLGAGDANKFIDQMETVSPQLKDYLEKKRLELSHVKSSENGYLHLPDSAEGVH
jgi:TolA-binding protein